MKIYLNRAPVVATNDVANLSTLPPWGGGNKFIAVLQHMLLAEGHEVCYELTPSDLYICFDPRPNSSGVSGYNILDFKRRWGGKLAYRIGDVGTHGKPALGFSWLDLLPHADVVVYPSEWARDYLIKLAARDNSRPINSIEATSRIRGHIVKNGALNTFFTYRREQHAPHVPLRIVTHHWSDNQFKGFDVYSHVAAHPDVEFTFIGRKPASCNIKCLQPMNAAELSVELPRHDVYLTASMYEAGANHVLEGMAAGLPVIYSSLGGSIPEYVGQHGVKFSDVYDVDFAIDTCLEKYSELLSSVASYKRTIFDTVDEFMTRVVYK